MLRIVIFQILILCFSQKPILANCQSDTPDSTRFSEDTTLFFPKFQHRITYSLDSGNFFITTGSPSLPHLNLKYQSTDSVFLNASIPYSQACFFSLNPSFQYNGQRPITIVQAEVNSSKEQLFYLGHKRDIGKSTGIWFKIFSFRTPGVFTGYLGNTFAIDWGSYFNWRKNIISIDAFHRKETFQLNGGVGFSEKEESFSFLGDSRKLLAPRWADLSIRKISTGVSSRIVVPLKAVAALSDNSAGLDSSVSAQPSQRIISGFKIESNYSLDYFFVNQAHSPEDTIFVNPPFLIDSSITSDRLRAAVFSNTFGFFHNSIDAKKYINPYFSFSLVEENQNFFKNISNSLLFGVKGGLNVFQTNITSHFQYGVSGYNIGNYLAEIKLKRPFLFFSNLNFFDIKLYSKKIAPNLLQRAYFGNNFFWRNNFLDVQKNGVLLGVSRNRMQLSGGFETLRNFIYYSSDFHPQQSSSTFVYAFGSIGANYEISNFFISPEFLFQKESSENQILRVPSLVCKSIIGYQLKLFKKALTLSPGIDLLYVSQFKGNYFLPQTGQFVLQENQLTGGYLLANFFLNFIIKDLKGYLKLDHLNDGIWPNKLGYMMAGYPLQGRVIRIGFVWNLVN